jgi:hypothetical protein
MLQFREYKAAGGILAALTDKCAEYIQSVLKGTYREPNAEVLGTLERIIVHADPHLDEYFAELLFRACLPKEKWSCDFIEQAVFSETDDLGCEHLWPSAAVLGVGSTYAGGTQPLFLFDEHVKSQSKVAASCSQIVAEKMFSRVPDSVQRVLREVNIIDEYGGGHPQNLNNLIKTMHDVRFWFGASANDGSQIRDSLSPQWKRSLVDACLVAIIYCLENGLDLTGNADDKKASLEGSLENYILKSPHASHERFEEAVHRIRSIYYDQGMVFKQAVLQNRYGPIKDTRGQSIPQLLLFSRVCFACEQCWGPQVRDMIATHFWEGELQNHLNFGEVEEAIDAAVRGQQTRAITPVGTITRHVLREADAMVAERRGGRKELKRIKPWVLTMTPAAGVSRASQALQHYLNKHNFGCGLILVKNSGLGTAALFKGASVPEGRWQRLVQLITSKEQECWHVIHQSTGTIAPFIVNGNKTHQYVPRSALDSTTLVELAKKTLY